MQVSEPVRRGRDAPDANAPARDILAALKPYLVLTGMFVGTQVLAWVVGFQMSIDSTLWQIIEPLELQNHLARSLLLLHTQPPLLNAALGLIYKLSAALHVKPEVTAKILLVGIGWSVVVLVFRLIREWTGSERLGMAGACIVMADPTFYYFMNLYFYEMPLMGLSVLLLWAGFRYFQTRSHRRLFHLVAILGGFTLLRHLFPPLWALSTFLLVALLGRAAHPASPRGGRGRLAAPLAGLLLLTWFWPLKNELIFGQFINTSLSGFNLARRWAPLPPELEAFATRGEVTDAAAARVPRVRFFQGDDLTILTSPRKSNGSINFNYYLFLLSDKELASEGIAARLHHPLEWAALSAYQYSLWNQPPYLHPYTRTLVGPDNDLYRRYARAYTSVVYFNLNHFTGKFGGFMSRRRVGLNLYGALIFPPALAIACLSLRRLWKTNPPRFAAMILLLWVLVFPMVVVCLTDGTEGNRMRAPSVPVVIVMMFWLLGDRLRSPLKKRPNRIRPEIAPDKNVNHAGGGVQHQS